jgi:hypothetical protein
MSDFLTRLAERTLGIAPVVQPINIPMFAPEAALPAAPQETTWGAVSQELTVSEPSPTSARPHARRPAHPPSPAEDSFAHAEAFSPALTSHPPRWQRGTRGDLPASEDRGERRVAPAPHAVASSMAAHPQASPAHFLSGAATVRRESAPQEDKSPSASFSPGHALEPTASSARPDSVPSGQRFVGPAPMTHPVPGPHVGARDPAKLAGQSAVRSTPVKRAGELPYTVLDAQSAPHTFLQETPPTPASERYAVPTPQSAPHVASQFAAPVPAPTRRPVAVEFPAPQTGAEPVSLPAAPTIRVSIGRIDVRAVLPPTPPAQRATSPRSGHKLSLEEYLKQRKGGSR